jgi:hypothetical protein
VGVAAHQGRLWVQIGDVGRPALVYLYSPNQEGQWPQAFLKVVASVHKAKSTIHKLLEAEVRYLEGGAM